MFIIPDVIRGLSHILLFSARGFPREYSCDRFVFVHFPEYYSGLSYIFRFSARGFPREFPYLYKKNKHHKCINSKTDATLLPYYLFLYRHYVPSAKQQQRCPLLPISL